MHRLRYFDLDVAALVVRTCPPGGVDMNEGGSTMSPQQDFITSAVGPAQASKKDTGVPAAVTIAQAILESGYGAKHIGEANNYFGIKASTKTDGTVDYGTVATGYVTVPTREVLNGKDVTIQAKFRKYASM